MATSDQEEPAIIMAFKVVEGHRQEDLDVLIFVMIASQSQFFKEEVKQSELLGIITEDELPPLKYRTPGPFDYV